jgi:Domain of unknown function (DUF5597)/Glycosyl hydrolases family 35
MIKLIMCAEKMKFPAQSLRKAAKLLRLGISVAAASVTCHAAVAQQAPHIRENGSVSQLIVDGKPFIALAGEVHNSSASSSTYMESVWARAEALNLNTLIAPVYWELLEPEEGRYDFRLIDDQITQARKRNMRLVLLWFGSIKNARSTYAPEWVLADPLRFPRAVTRPSKLPFGNGHPALSLFNEKLLTADARAFAKLMDHLQETDPQHVVIAVQVQNETGILGDSRDRSSLAESAWNAPVPQSLIAYLTRMKGRLSPALEAIWARNGYRSRGTWAQVFGNDWQADEAFMAWQVSRFVETVAATGKAKHDLPMYANAWIGPQRPGEPAGNYPSGGPVPRVFDIWKAGAPSLAWIAPDIYVDDFEGWAAQYASASNPLFVPEARFIVGNLFVALGQYRAIGFSPFGIEAGQPGNQLSEAYGLLRGAVPVIADAQASGLITGFALAPGGSHRGGFGDYTFTVRGQRESVSKMLLDMGITVPTAQDERKPQNIGDHASELSDLRPMGLVMMLAPGEFLVVGKDLSIDFYKKSDPTRPVELASVQEGHFEDGHWIPGRTINGDERLRIVPASRFGMVKIKLLNRGAR